jgi:hypothetical protein
VCVCVCYLYNNNTKKKMNRCCCPPPLSLQLQPPHMRVLLARWPTWYKSFYTHHVPPDKHFSLSLFSFSFLFRYFYFFFTFVYPSPFFRTVMTLCVYSKMHTIKKREFFFLFWNDEICKSRRLKGLTLFEVCCVIYTRDVCPHLEGFKKLGGCLFFSYYYILLIHSSVKRRRHEWAIEKKIAESSSLSEFLNDVTTEGKGEW